MISVGDMRHASANSSCDMLSLCLRFLCFVADIICSNVLWFFSSGAMGIIGEVGDSDDSGDSGGASDASDARSWLFRRLLSL